MFAGIGMTFFHYYLLYTLACKGCTVVYESVKFSKSYMFKQGRVLEGRHGAFHVELQDANTW